MSYTRTLKKIKVTHGFYEKRYYGLHGAIDYSNIDPISIYSGNVVFAKNSTSHCGSFLQMKSYTDEGELFFQEFLHLKKDSFLFLTGEPVRAGIVIADMGNTGNCLTYDEQLKKYRKLTDDERVAGIRGAHTHYQEFVKTSLSIVEFPALIENMINKEIIVESDVVISNLKRYNLRYWKVPPGKFGEYNDTLQ